MEKKREPLSCSKQINMDEIGISAMAAQMSGCVDQDYVKGELESAGSNSVTVREGPSSNKWAGALTDGQCYIAKNVNFGPRSAHDFKLNSNDETSNLKKQNVFTY